MNDDGRFMSRLGARTVLLGLLSLASVARGETLIARGAHAAAASDFPAALAYLDAALAHPHVGADELRTFVAARDSYAGRWVLQTLAKLGPLTDANAETAFGQLSSIKRVLDRDHLSNDALDRALAVTTELVLARVDRLEAAGDFGLAEAWLTTLTTATGMAGDKLVQLRARAYAARASEGPEVIAHPAAALLHLAAAARYAPAGFIPTALAAARATLADRTTIAIGGSSSGSCFSDRAAIGVAAPAGPGVPVHVDARFTSCTTAGPSVERGTTQLDYPVVEEQLIARDHIVDRGYECYSKVTALGLTTYTSNVSRPGCVMPLYTIEQDPPERRRIESVGHETVGLTRTTYTASAAAHVTATWPGDSIELDIVSTGTSGMVVYDRPEFARPMTDIGTATAAEAQGKALAALQHDAYAIEAQVRGKLAAAAMARAARAADPLTREDELVIAAIVNNRASPELVQLVAQRYHIGASELSAALFERMMELPELGEPLVMREVGADELTEDTNTYRAMFLHSATGRSAYAITFGAGYARSTAIDKAETGAFVFVFDYFASFSIAGPLAWSTLVDVRYGRGGLLETRFALGAGVNLDGVLVHPFVGAGFDRLGFGESATAPSLAYDSAFVAEAGVRAGFAIPHLVAIDGAIARRRRSATSLVAENRFDLELRFQPVSVGLQYTQLLAENGQQGQLLEIVGGFGF